MTLNKINWKNAAEWLWRVSSVILIPLVVAGITWARGMEGRVTASEISIRLIEQREAQHNTSSGDLARELVALRSLNSEILQRLARIETKLEGR